MTPYIILHMPCNNMQTDFYLCGNIDPPYSFPSCQLQNLTASTLAQTLDGQIISSPHYTWLPYTVHPNRVSYLNYPSWLQFFFLHFSVYLEKFWKACKEPLKHLLKLILIMCIGTQKIRCLQKLEAVCLLELEIHTVVNYMTVKMQETQKQSVVNVPGLLFSISLVFRNVCTSTLFHPLSFLQSLVLITAL